MKQTINFLLNILRWILIFINVWILVILTITSFFYYLLEDEIESLYQKTRK